MLNKADEMVSLMVEEVKHNKELDINNLRDQFGRSALHYAYASTDCSHLIQILLGAGCSEAVFDMVVHLQFVFYVLRDKLTNYLSFVFSFLFDI